MVMRCTCTLVVTIYQILIPLRTLDVNAPVLFPKVTFLKLHWKTKFFFSIIGVPGGRKENRFALLSVLSFSFVVVCLFGCLLHPYKSNLGYCEDDY